MARDSLYYEVMDVFQGELNSWKRIIRTLEVVMKMGFVSRDAYSRWRMGDIETLDDGFTVPRSRIVDSALCLRTIARAYGYDQVDMPYLCWEDKSRTLRISRVKGIRRLLANGYRVRRKARREQVAGMLEQARKLADERRKECRPLCTLEELQENIQRRKRYARCSG